MLRTLTWLGRAGALALAVAGAFATGAATPVTQGWAADPDDQFLLDVKLRQYRLGDGVRAYATPEGTCIVFGDFLATLDVPMKIDLTAKKASGWAFKEANAISIDVGSNQVRYGGKAEALARGAVRETPEGWCIESAALARWFGIGVRPMTSGSVLILESEAKLPVELAIEREKRSASLKKAKLDLSTLPQVRLPYRMWRAPALDFVVSGGLTYRADTGAKVDRQASVYAAGELAHLSYDAQLTTSRKGIPSQLRLRAYRSDPDGHLLGPLQATHVGVGDVSGFETRLTGTSASGRGAVVTNRPLVNPSSFDRTRFEGDLPSGWDAELYRNGQLLGFARSDSRQRYVFEDIQLLYGDNDFSVILYGPQGQVRARSEQINVGRENVPPGKTWYWAGVNQPGRDVIGLREQSPDKLLPKTQATIAVEHGLDVQTSVGALARSMLLDDERVTFVEASVRRSLGPALTEVALARDDRGGTAIRGQVLAKVGSVNLSAEGIAADDFRLAGRPRETVKQGRVSIDAPVRIGRAVIPAHADVRLRKRSDGSGELEAATRLSANIGRFNLASSVGYKRQYLAGAKAPPGEVVTELIGTGRVGDVRLRGGTSFEITPHARLRSTEVSAYWSASDRVDWEGAVAYDASLHRSRARVTHVRRMDAMAFAVTGEAASDGSFALGFNLNFSLDPGSGMRLSRQPMAQAGIVEARVFRDLNGNGLRETDEPVEKGAVITTGTVAAPKATDASGSVVIAGLTAFTPLVVGIDRASLDDPLLAPKKAMQVVVPRPGIPARVDIPLVGSGDVEGSVVKNGGLGFEGLDLELVDAAGKVVATARSDFDGFFLFEGVPYGQYRIRVATESATAGAVDAELNIDAVVTPDAPVARVGAITVAKALKLASTQ
ncbi:carboxypeptidase regulatory-like domain-containing protein [Sphingomonas sinipercae]|uniref:Carboxypeptidase regulatory-like domain-containing protein n=1 Tax=Sphingomonas sinipercae TaxID=2714944 RepID=A0A6G7ZKV1_9SPHN|nr:carboxypeptidase-like regulatory domain-containing protein [Sphingomonas sinipercae]QIL01540.1 carboxypeptidase regulatory-like domain-containing protein [Sphingomonas sinipercae]